MSILKTLAVSSDMETEVDRSTSSLPRVFESGVYDVVIDTAYIDSSASGAISANFVFKAQDGRTLNQTIYITSGEAKGRLPYYIRDGKKIPLPGFSTANSIALLTVGEEINTLETETKVLSLYDYDAKKNTPQQKEVIMDLLGQEVTLGVLRVIEDKRVKDSSGNYVPSGETRIINEIDKVFRTSDKMTTSEIRKGKTEPEYFGSWSEANTGKTRDKSEGKKGETRSGSAPAAASSDAPAKEASTTKKLFGG